MTDEAESSLTSVPSSYLNYLPACYASADTGGGLPFLALYLKMFEKLLSGIADGDDLEQADSALDARLAYRIGIRQLLDADVIGNMFYPRWSFLFPNSDPSVFIPPLSEDTVEKDKTALFNTLANYFGLPQYVTDPDRRTPVEVWVRSFFEWLGSTIGLSVDKNWSIDTSRTLVAKAFAFDRARGTPMGMEWLLEALLPTLAQPVKGVTLGKIMVSDCERPAFIVRETDTDALPAFHVRDSYPDPTKAVVISDDVRPDVQRDGIDFEANDSEMVAHVPWRFEIAISLTASSTVSEDDETTAVLAYYRALRTVLETARPALTAYAVHFTVSGGDTQHVFRMDARRTGAS
ncbi:phage tail protein [Trinickia sp. Y13]|uniref:phage tail protein n=1 Tax=Trinickia sp. Y13 TaxID=2917807 RepID=UPI0024051342|nr:phage tail protein [Trinickia sp. Y13]MDG0022879.1 phage tail protein [Trinickia sp. Y13]